MGVINSAGCFVLLAIAVVLADGLAKNTVSYYNFFYMDALSGYFILIIAVVAFVASLYSINYLRDDVSEGVISAKRAMVYYVLFDLFVFTMLFTTVVNNTGVMWVAIEMTTLVSALLVGLYNKESSIEAAWKYIIICSVGISLALLGTILMYYTAFVNGNIHSLNWTDINAVSNLLNPGIVKIAFVFILIGYGTKAGIAPMHTWLPDAHSQALAPISAMLSGVLLKTAVYAIIRYMIIVNHCTVDGFSGNLLIFFGVLSVLLPAGFILIQKDIKRLLAYSSIEHIGVILFGLGVGGWLGLYGALFHIFNHAINKSLMFFGAGSIIRKYKTHNMRSISGVTGAMPFTGFFVVLGVFALCGMPPFSIFFSELMILISGFSKGRYASTAVVIFALALIFAALAYHFTKILFGKKPPEIEAGENVGAGSKTAFILTGALIAVLGIWMPKYLHVLIESAIKVIKG
jgi:hydrogenase-4 component F